MPLNLIGFVLFCVVVLAGLYFQSADSKAKNRLPPTGDLALGDLLKAVNSLQDLLDSLDLNKLSGPQVLNIRSAQFKVENAMASYARCSVERSAEQISHD